MSDLASAPGPDAPPMLWGAATSSYQIEGATDEDGRGPSIWDTFCAAPGRIADGSSGKQACDHYRRWAEDVASMRWLGLDAYRFSVAWPRVLPEGRGRVNAAGLDFYERLVDALLEAGIAPFVTLYHWDLPQALEDRGGWRSRETVDAFVEYADVVAARLADRVGHWCTQNEPWCAAFLGHLRGEHAPGLTDGAAAVTAAHHLLLAHGRAAGVLRARRASARIGLAHAYTQVLPASDSEADAAAARRIDGEMNRWFLDPLYGRGYPQDILQRFGDLGYLDPASPAFVLDGDLETIAAPTDYLGVNYYTRAVARSDAIPEADNLARRIFAAPPEARTDMGWEVYPRGLQDGLRRLHADYRPRALYVTENGAAYATPPDADGRVRDEARERYLSDHVAACVAARAEGVPLAGYFAWSLLDNFEWAHGYAKRFGLLWVDYDSQARVPKDSARWYRAHIERVRAERGRR